MAKTLNVKSTKDSKTKVSDVEIVGNPDSFRLLCKASSKKEKWMKSAKALEIPGVGCVVQVTTQQGSAVAEALTFVPGATIVDDVKGGRRLVSIESTALISIPPAAPERLNTVDTKADEAD